jgi:uncharacterized protein
MNCPNCREVKLTLSERQGIEIDYCPDCRGIWLDRGELDKILEKSKAPLATENRDSFNTQSGPSYYQQKPYKRKKSFLEELFD